MSITQPDKIHLQETDDPNWGTMQQLLAELREAFALQSQHFNDLVKQAADAGLAAVSIIIVILYICWCCPSFVRQYNLVVLLYFAGFYGIGPTDTAICIVRILHALN